MEEYKFYYRFKSIAIDTGSEKEIKKYNKELVFFSELEQQFEALKEAYENKMKIKDATIVVNVLPKMQGVFEFGVCHQIKFKLFSKNLKKNCFSVFINKCEENGDIYFYDYETCDTEEVKAIFKNLIENNTLPNLSSWNATLVCNVNE